MCFEKGYAENWEFAIWALVFLCEGREVGGVSQLGEHPLRAEALKLVNAAALNTVPQSYDPPTIRLFHCYFVTGIVLTLL